MKPEMYANYYALGLAQFHLNQIKQENEMLKVTAGATVPIPAYNFLPPSRVENIGPSCKFSNCFEPVKPPEPSEYERGYMAGWMSCTDYFIRKESGGGDGDAKKKKET